MKPFIIPDTGGGCLFQPGQPGCCCGCSKPPALVTPPSGPTTNAAVVPPPPVTPEELNLPLLQSNHESFQWLSTIFRLSEGDTIIRINESILAKYA